MNGEQLTSNIEQDIADNARRTSNAPRDLPIAETAWRSEREPSWAKRVARSLVSTVCADATLAALGASWLLECCIELCESTCDEDGMNASTIVESVSLESESSPSPLELMLLSVPAPEGWDPRKSPASQPGKTEEAPDILLCYGRYRSLPDPIRREAMQIAREAAAAAL